MKVGEVVDGKYSVTRVLGQGGMGMVVEAYRDTLDQHVAIKFMRSDMVAASGGAERFLREAQALVKLKSQHAVKVYDMGVHRRMPYIVMEHLEGMDMQGVLDKHGPMRAADAARHIRQACEAISEAHSLGIYHRDLKPANLFLANGPDARVIVKVLDFGIAKMMRPPADKAAIKNSLTGMHIVIGTLPYMSPEQISSPKDIDGRADIWSLGVVLYELVTGELPFGGQDMSDLKSAIENASPDMSKVPKLLAPIVQRCLAKNPGDRFPSAKELAMALRPLLDDSLSPFGVPSARVNTRTPQAAVVEEVPNTVPSPTAKHVDLALAEGLTSRPNSAMTLTVREPKGPQVIIRDKYIPLTAPDSDEEVTLRVDAPMTQTGTLVMHADTAEPVTIKRPPSDRPAAPSVTLVSPATTTPIPKRAPVKPAVVGFEHRVETVRRGVLVVKEPLKLSRRQRSSSRRGLLVVAAGMACAMGFGLAWLTSQGMDWAQSLSATPTTESPILDGERSPNDDGSLDSAPHSRPLPALPND